MGHAAGRYRPSHEIGRTGTVVSARRTSRPTSRKTSRWTSSRMSRRRRPAELTTAGQPALPHGESLRLPLTDPRPPWNGRAAGGCGRGSGVSVRAVPDDVAPLALLPGALVGTAEVLLPHQLARLGSAPALPSDRARPPSPRTSSTAAVRHRHDVRRRAPGARRPRGTAVHLWHFCSPSRRTELERIAHTNASRPDRPDDEHDQEHEHT